MVDAEIIREWLTKADEDFGFARINYEEQSSFFAQICFHFQQSAEKYLKAYIIAHQLTFRKVHDLPMLLNIIVEKDKTFEQVRDECEFLATFYVETRYPVSWPTQFSQDETEKCFDSAKRIKSFVREKLQL